MDQKKRRLWLIQYLIGETAEYQNIDIPADEAGQKILLRSLMNIRPPEPITEEFIQIQDAYLTEETLKKNITRLEDLSPVREHIYLWQGDITSLKTDGIVNAGNSSLLGCFVPCHGCIDNAVHSAAGVQLRLECRRLMEQHGLKEPAGNARITEAYNLPCRYILHTVGPVIRGVPTVNDRRLLAACYYSCLKMAADRHLTSLAFCCISTGEFHFPNDIAAEIAISTTTDFIKSHTGMEVVFNVFKENDYKIYRRLLAAD